MLGHLPHWPTTGIVTAPPHDDRSYAWIRSPTCYKQLFRINMQYQYASCVHGAHGACSAMTDAIRTTPKQQDGGKVATWHTKKNITWREKRNTTENKNIQMLHCHHNTFKLGPPAFVMGWFSHPWIQPRQAPPPVLLLQFWVGSAPTRSPNHPWWWKTCRGSWLNLGGFALFFA